MYGPGRYVSSIQQTNYSFLFFIYYIFIDKKIKSGSFVVKHVQYTFTNDFLYLQRLILLGLHGGLLGRGGLRGVTPTCGS